MGSAAAIVLLVCFQSNFSHKIGPIEFPQKLRKYVFWPYEAIPGLRFPRKTHFFGLFCKTMQILVAPGTTAPSSDGKIRGQNIDLHQNLNRVDLSSTSLRIRQCKNISPTPIQWLRISILVPKWHMLTSQRVAIMGCWYQSAVRAPFWCWGDYIRSLGPFVIDFCR